jgi:hypothetical protein
LSDPTWVGGPAPSGRARPADESPASILRSSRNPLFRLRT